MISENTKQDSWIIIGKSVCGASHLRTGLPNQDAIVWHPSISPTEFPVIMAVADGHGGTRYFRSDKGSEFAVNAAREVVSDFLQANRETANLSIIKTSVEEWLPKAIIRNWTERVGEHFRNTPFAEQEISKLDENDAAKIDAEYITAYGTTLLLAVVGKDFLIFLQLGDGDILTVYGDDEIQRPLPDDDRLIGNQTTSLCSVNAWKDFRINFQPLADNYPNMIFLSTDGYSNSFRDDQGFKKVAADIYQMLKSGEEATIQNNLADWLNESSIAGSGDDITAGILFRKVFDETYQETDDTPANPEHRMDTGSLKPAIDLSDEDLLGVNDC